MKKVMVASCTHSHGRPIAGVRMSPSTSRQKPLIAMPHRIISRFSSQSSARHFRWRCSCKTSRSKRIGCQMSDVRCQMSDVRCQMSDVRCQMSDVRCQMSDVRCQMSDVRCQMSHVRCQMSDVRCHMLDVRYHMSDVKYQM